MTAINQTSLVVISAIVFLGVTLLSGPQVGDWMFRISTLMMLAISWNLMANAGLISLGHSAFWGVGSYAAILSANAWGLPIYLSLIVSMVFGSLLGLFLAVATGRLRGIFFAISTLALSEGLRISAFMMPEITNGAVGLFLNQALRPSTTLLYVVGCVGAVIAVVVSVVLSRSRFHFACRAMRNNEPAAQMLGIRPYTYRIVLLAISGAMASCAGGINAWYGGYLDPEVAFTLHFTILSQIAPILGGVHTLVGPIIGSFAIVGLAEASRIFFGQQEGFSQLIYGLVLIVGILFMPAGIWGTVRSFLNRSATRKRREAAVASAAGRAEVKG
ncbi:MAG: branched-chain amino acid ABC transporter permease [Aquamicrobium sp.]|uniref:branched-chain amino acid ABC transporter permease n=1 Tax=Aquamicrobium sp. TaxID=1872579 RepID=UPI00349E885B|nr:branched-chain amino acid ABC transporter permease [Aquamicrobium sp.]